MASDDERTYPRLALPSIESFNDDEILLARVTIGVVRGGGAMYNGRFIECVVARLLSASFPLLGISPWDLVLDDGTRIEVRSGTTTFALTGPKDVDLWVFVHKVQPDPLFSVASSAHVAAVGRKSISAAKLAALFPPVHATDLAAAVAATRSRSQSTRSRR